MAKYLTLGILLVGFIIGVVGSFIGTFNMDGYINFLKSFEPLYISLIASTGANSAVEKYKEE